MNVKRVSAAADVICAAMKNGKALPLSWAAALESAGLLQSPESADELQQLKARVAELEAQRDRRRGRLVALQNDALNMRGLLSPNGEARKVPFPLGNTLTPAVDWLIGRVAELEALKPARFQDCRVCGAGYEYGQACAACAFNERMVAERVARGELAEQRHLMDSLDHDFEVLPVRRSVPLSEMQRMSGDPLGDTPAVPSDCP
ncbi:hypothetical protein [Streptomyces sp. NBC_01508]|uniref:hypothetical protein n=1 Tax=Streptomyces sp. NBC_01508 TaxID=2903888 RepID=UPI00386A803F